MKLSDELRGEINMGCQWVNNGPEGSDELSENDELREFELSGSDCTMLTAEQHDFFAPYCLRTSK